MKRNYTEEEKREMRETLAQSRSAVADLLALVFDCDEESFGKAVGDNYPLDKSADEALVDIIVLCDNLAANIDTLKHIE